ncbi:MAG TPA: hypothetical protein VFO62_01060, partial [Candidatus Binatia bacterium]|nr:hypothetical protein [Candidatus Binatia bacterium]
MATKKGSNRSSSDRPNEGGHRSRFAATGAAERIAKLAASDTPTLPRPPASVAANPRLLFILSTERSGSTLLSLALGANERHVSPPEMHLLAYPTFDAWYADYPSAMLS